MTTFPLAPQGVYPSIQGEGVMLGVPMAFVRFAGCDLNCHGCDTDYSLANRLPLDDLVRAVLATNLPWAWLTGGEPTLHALGKLVPAIRSRGLRVAMVTHGGNPSSADGWPVHEGSATGGVDLLYVSPHAPGDRWKVRAGTVLNVVPALNGLRLADLARENTSNFGTRYVTPCDGRPETVAECREFVLANPGWRLGVQAHKFWNLP